VIDDPPAVRATDVAAPETRSPPAAPVRGVRDGYGLLLDRAVVFLRASRPTDVDALLDLHRRVSGRSRYFRFFTGAADVEREVRRLSRPPDADHAVVVAEHDGLVVAVASYERLDVARAELALLVDDDWQGRGVGTLLLERLASYARAAGIAELTGEVLAANGAMLEAGSGLAPGVSRSRADDPGMVHLVIPTTLDRSAVDAAAERDRRAERESLRPLLEPSSVAVVGVSRRGHGVGRAVLRTLRAGGYTGRIFAVNPRAERVAGLRAYPSVSAIGLPVDLAVIAVPVSQVRSVVEDCATTGVGAVVILAARADDDPSRSQAAEEGLVELARAHGMRIIGPNCIGVANPQDDVCLSATFAPQPATPGALAVASQSGAVGIALLEAATRDQVGISTFVSLGNAADVSTNDLLAYWHDDPRSRVVALYVESFGNPRRFAVLARSLSRRKPVLVVKSGRSPAGQRAGASHTGVIATADATVDALFRQAGVLRFDTLGELLDAARFLADQPLPAGPRLGVVGNAGGLNVLAADAARGMGLVLPELPPSTQHRITRKVPHPAGATNPVDLGADVSPAALTQALRAVAESGAVDALVVTLVATATTDIEGLMRAVASPRPAAPALPVALVVVGATSPRRLGRLRVPVYDLPENAVRAVGHADRYRRLRDEPEGRRPDLAGVDVLQARRTLVDLPVRSPGWQEPDVAVRLLASYGIPCIETRVAAGAEEAERAATSCGFPVAVKSADASLVHRTEAGAVHLDVVDGTAVRRAYVEIARATKTDDPRVIVQPMAGPGLEVIVGVRHDPAFGSVVTLGAGGVHTEILSDHSVRAVPLTDLAVRQMWQQLRSAPLFTGYRGEPGVDTAALEDLLVRVGRLAEDNPELAELDLNPVVLGWRHDDTGPPVCVVDVKLRLHLAGPEPDGTLRDL
jgi:acyl-CoA synthetase (NDP forming)/GNAT superfamily N-acetyltransferase